MSPAISNIVVNAVVWAMLMKVCGNQEAQHGLVWASEDQDVVFYADDGRIAGRNPMWVQGALILRAWIFEQVGLYTNLGKTNSMTCTPGFIWG